jgi:putative peptidoglycan lipid II flippase
VPAALVAAIGRAGLYASRHFASAATANFLPSAFALTAMLLHPAGDIRWVAVVIVLGYWLALGWLVVALAVSGANPYRRWYRYIPEAVRFWRNPAVRQIGRDLTAPMLGLLSRQGVVLAERWFGSFLPPGSVSALGYANKITTVLAGVVFDSLTTAGLPGLTRALSQRMNGVATREWRRLLSFCLGSALPLGIGLALVSRPLLVFLFARSGSAQLDTATALKLASVMAVYFLGLIPLGLFRAQQSYLYAVQRPAWVAVLLFLATLITLLLDWPLVRLLDAAGLALSFSAGMIVASLFAFGLIRRYRIPA